jgi:tRNA nucleotidyltransferase (CCA-adding enzyme)
MGFRAFVVGGAVRDLLLGQKTLDLDIVVEGEGIPFAVRLAESLQARLKSHERFGTATIIFQDGLRLDVATARTEVYDRPAALPRVTPGSIRDDMYRRDFTINAMAASLMPGEYGRLLDDFRGLRDLRQRRIRVLHEKSFLDDPTRIFRAVRFESRLGFRIVRSTRALIDEALSRRILDGLEDYRVATELRLILEEPEPAGPVRRLAELGIFDSLNSRSLRDRGLGKQLRRAGDILRQDG